MILPSFFEWLSRATNQELTLWLSEIANTLQFAILVVLTTHLVISSIRGWDWVPGAVFALTLYVLLAYLYIDATIWRTGEQPSIGSYFLAIILVILMLFATWQRTDGGED